MSRIFIGCPTYNGEVNKAVAASIYATATQEHEAVGFINEASLTTVNMNNIYASALNRRKQGFSWFAMIHADIIPPLFWVDTLMREAEEHDADFISAVVPIKDSRGLTSTAIAHPDHIWAPYTRLTQSQINHADFPQTFDLGVCCSALASLPAPLTLDVPRTYLLCNTGLMLCRLDRDWSDKVYFTVQDRIFKVDDTYITKALSEDWFFSRKIAEYGGRVFSTKAVEVEHLGRNPIPSNGVWGEPLDEDCLSEHKNAHVYAA